MLINGRKCGVYIHSEILFTHKRHEILTFMITWMGLEDIMLSEMQQAQKDIYFTILFYK
jgi:hypothetical protein